MNPELEKLNGASLDIAADKKNQLKQLFPTVFTETANEKGELVESVDFERLKAELGHFSEIFENRRERYGMDWPGKKDALRLIQTPSTATLKPCREESVNFDTTENLFIEGDNLEVLKLLQKSYYGKVKMIYIDPPYNTGNEFIYPDKYSESLQTYLEYAGLVDGEGKKFSSNTANEGRFHTRWLNMMYPRLYLARNLLRNNGMIFISIDENEAKNLRRICDEIFGETNFIEQIVWKNKYGSGALTKGFANVHEYILVYSKDIIANLAAPLNDEQRSAYKLKDDKFSKRGGYITQPLATTSKDDRPNLVYPIYHNGNEIWPEKQWIWAKERYEQAYKNDEIVINENDGKFSVRMKQYLRDENGVERLGKPLSILNGPFNQEGTKEISELLGKGIFDFPKPSALIRYFFSFTINDQDEKDGIYLDFFSGSASSAHAVLDLNQQDGGNRKYIMVQLPEPCDLDSIAIKKGFKTIADIGKERIRQIIRKLNEEQSKKLDLDGNTEQDRGFKVLKLNKSNFKQWHPLFPDTAPQQIADQLEMYIDHVDDNATPEDILYEILIKAGFMPTEKVENINLAGIPVFSIANGDLLICLADQVTKELVDAVVEREPLQFICPDAAFHGNDQLKANIVQTFASRNMGREKANQIIFKTI